MARARTASPWDGARQPAAFYVHDDVQAVVETLTAEIRVTQPREIADYAKAFTALAGMAVYGDAARALIHAAIDSLE
jgi:hypothetical protein